MKKVIFIILIAFALAGKAYATPIECRNEITGRIIYGACNALGQLTTSVATGTISIIGGTTSGADVLLGTNNALFTAITDGTDTLEITASAAKVFAVDFDIRDLTSASDTVSIEGGNVTDVSIDDGGNSLTVDATDLDIRNLTSASDTVTAVATDLDIRNLTSASDTVSIEGGNVSAVTVDAVDLDIRNLTAASDTITAVATDLDIRNLTSGSDTVTIQGGNTVDVSIDDGGNAITVDATDLDIRNLTAASDTVTISGSVTPTYWSTTEFVNYGVPTASASGANLDPAASSNKFTVQNNYTEAVWVKTGATPAENDGIKLNAGATWIVENVTVTDLEIYNPGAATAQIAVNYWR